MFHRSFSLTLNLVGGQEPVSVCQIEFLFMPSLGEVLKPSKKSSCGISVVPFLLMGFFGRLG